MRGRATTRLVALALLGATAACGPAAVRPVPDEPVQPTTLPEPQPPRQVVRIHPFGEQPPEADEDEPASAPASSDHQLGTRIAKLSSRRCFAELRRAGVAYRRVHQEVDDVKSPILLMGPIGGVTSGGDDWPRLVNEAIATTPQRTKTRPMSSVARICHLPSRAARPARG